MLIVPTELLDYLSQLIEQERCLAFLKVDKQGYVVELGGNWTAYGIMDLAIGDLVAEKLGFLCGLLPLQEEKIILPQIKLESELSADLHIFPSDNADWVMLLSVAEEERKQQIMQQKINDLSLLRDKQAKMLGMMLGSETENITQEVRLFGQNDLQKEVSVLFIDLRNFTRYSEDAPSDEVFKVLNLYLRTIILPIIDEAGILDKIIGDGVMAIFGVLPSTAVSARQALRASLRALQAINELNLYREKEKHPTFELGIGIASGAISLGIISGKEQKFLAALGQPVKLAANLERQAEAKEILVDETTFQKLAELQTKFSQKNLVITNQPISAFSWIYHNNDSKAW